MSDIPLEAQVDKILHRMARHYEAVALGIGLPNKTDFAHAKQQLTNLISIQETKARVDELKEFMSYDWYGTDDNGNENVYFNDGISEYAKERINQLNSNKDKVKDNE